MSIKELIVGQRWRVTKDAGWCYKKGMILTITKIDDDRVWTKADKRYTSPLRSYNEAWEAFMKRGVIELVKEKERPLRFDHSDVLARRAVRVNAKWSCGHRRLGESHCPICEIFHKVRVRS